MKARKRLLVSFAAMLLLYFIAYFLSVRVNYLFMKSADLAVPVYRPLNEEGIPQWVAQKFFAPAQLIDAAFLRPSKWQDRRR
jgi:hypothetical protein